MAAHTINLDDNVEAGLQAELSRRDGVKDVDELISIEVGHLGREYYAVKVRADADAVTNAFLAATPEQQNTFREKVVPIAISDLGMEIPQS